jgi:hypothetical protein
LPVNLLTGLLDLLASSGSHPFGYLLNGVALLLTIVVFVFVFVDVFVVVVPGLPSPGIGILGIEGLGGLGSSGFLGSHGGTLNTGLVVFGFGTKLGGTGGGVFGVFLGS